MTLDIRSSRQLPQSRGPLVQDVGMERFRQQEEQDDPREAVDEEQDPERPSPSEVHGAVSTNRRRRNGTQNGTHRPETDDVRELLLWPHVSEGRSSGSERWGTEESSERAGDEDGGHVLSDGRGHGEEGEEGEGDDVHWSTT